MVYKVRENTLAQYNLTFNGYIAKYKPFHGVRHYVVYAFRSFRNLGRGMGQPTHGEVIHEGHDSYISQGSRSTQLQGPRVPFISQATASLKTVKWVRKSPHLAAGGTRRPARSAVLRRNSAHRLAEGEPLAR